VQPRGDKLRPARILTGSLCNGMPHRDLMVSWQNRMLASSNISQRIFGVRDALIFTIRLVILPGILIEQDLTEVVYIHLLFYHHEIIYAEQAPNVSLVLWPSIQAILSI
jgi:hypothetical protein